MDNTEKKTNENAEKMPPEATEKTTPLPLNPEQLRANMQKMAKGKMKLETPLRSKSKDVTELEYDFGKLSGWEYAEAMDGDPNARNVFKVTAKQAMNLFAKAVEKCGVGIDATDVKSRLGLVDTVKAVQLATIFLVTCSQVADSNTLSV